MQRAEFQSASSRKFTKGNEFMQRKNFHIEIKAVAEDGTFEGMLSTYGNKDLGGDVVEKGAFTKTLKDNGTSVPMLWQHNESLPIGMLELTDTPEGLHCQGTLALEVPQAQTAHALLKRKIVKGLSIGYDAIKATFDDAGVRHLKEIRLWEGSVVTFGMNLQALIASVKSSRAAETKDDFAAELQEIQIYAARYQMIQALCESLGEILTDEDTADKPAASRDSIQQFSDAYLAMLPEYLALMAEDAATGNMGWMSRPGFEHKAGRVLSQANLDLVAKCITDLQALYDAATTTDGAAGKGTSQEAAKQHSIEPDVIHSALEQYKSKFSEATKWN
jgi:uncharacterized protein